MLSFGNMTINTEFKTKQFKIIYSTETATETYINEIHLYNAHKKWENSNTKWQVYNFQKLATITNKDAYFGRDIQLLRYSH